MIDFIAKARANRIAALTAYTNGSAMFFPEEQSLDRDDPEERSAPRAPKAMFVRSQSGQTSAAISAPSIGTVAVDDTATALHDVFVLTEDLAVSKKRELAA